MPYNSVPTKDEITTKGNVLISYFRSYRRIIKRKIKKKRLVIPTVLTKRISKRTPDINAKEKTHDFFLATARQRSAKSTKGSVVTVASSKKANKKRIMSNTLIMKYYD